MSDQDKVFAGALPLVYDTYLVPLIFEPYAIDLAARVRAVDPRRVLELACGTGVVTRTLAAMLPEGVAIIAVDLNPGMVERAEAVGTARPVVWQQGDASRLPFEDGAFDLVVCQFGVMFFPDKAQAFSEMRRVLMPGGTCIFSVWDDIATNDFAATVSGRSLSVFPPTRRGSWRGLRTATTIARSSHGISPPAGSTHRASTPSPRAASARRPRMWQWRIVRGRRFAARLKPAILAA